MIVYLCIVLTLPWNDHNVLHSSQPTSHGGIWKAIVTWPSYSEWPINMPRQAQCLQMWAWMPAIAQFSDTMTSSYLKGKVVKCWEEFTELFDATLHNINTLECKVKTFFCINMSKHEEDILADHLALSTTSGSDEIEIVFVLQNCISTKLFQLSILYQCPPVVSCSANLDTDFGLDVVLHRWQNMGEWQHNDLLHC